MMGAIDRDEFRDAMERMSGEMSRGFTRIEHSVTTLGSSMSEMRETVAEHAAILNVTGRSREHLTQDLSRIPKSDGSLPQDRRKLTLWDAGLILAAIGATVAFLKFFGRL